MNSLNTTVIGNRYIIMLLDNGGIHKAKRVVISDNVVLLFLSPSAPNQIKSRFIPLDMATILSGSFNDSSSSFMLLTLSEAR